MPRKCQRKWLLRRDEPHRDVAELVEVPPRELDDDVVERRLKARGRRLCHLHTHMHTV